MPEFGTAKTDNFLFGQASVMLGPQADAFDLTQANSIGLVKNVKVMQDSGFAELAQGTQGSIVMSLRNSAAMRVSFECYEFTSKNLAYGLGLDGSALTEQTIAGTASALVTGNDIVVDIALTSGASFAIGQWVSIAVQDGYAESTLIRKITNKVTNTITVNAPIPTGVTIPNLAAVKVLNAVKVADKSAQPPFLSAKIVGALANGTIVTLLIPKVRITKGFDMSFGNQDYGNLPFEMAVMDLTASDTGYTESGGASAFVLQTK